MDSLASYLPSDNILGFEGAGKLVLNSGASDEVAAWCCTKNDHSLQIAITNNDVHAEHDIVHLYHLYLLISLQSVGQNCEIH